MMMEIPIHMEKWLPQPNKHISHLNVKEIPKNTKEMLCECIFHFYPLKQQWRQFEMLGCIPEVLTLLLTPILSYKHVIYDIYDICDIFWCANHSVSQVPWDGVEELGTFHFKRGLPGSCLTERGAFGQRGLRSISLPLLGD